MQHSTVVIIIILSLMAIGIPLLVFAELPFEMEFNYKGFDITLYVLDELPDWCDSIAACAVYGIIDGEQVNIIVINQKYLNTKDTWGNSILYHEIKHILCQCDWHANLRMI